MVAFKETLEETLQENLEDIVKRAENG
jgi:hypothetical protein